MRQWGGPCVCYGDANETKDKSMLRKSVNANKYASVQHVRPHTYTRTGIIWPFMPSHKGRRPPWWSCDPTSASCGDSFAEWKQLPHKCNLIFALKLSSSTTKGQLSGRGTGRGARASTRVPTQCDILSNDRHSRWRETDTRVCPCISGLCRCHPPLGGLASESVCRITPC